MNTIKKHSTVVRWLLLLLGGLSAGSWADQKVPQQDGDQTLPLQQFISKAAQNDTGFEAILLDRMPLGYRRDSLLPERDLMLEIKQQMVFFEGGRRDAATSIALSQLFASTGTRVSAAYDKAAAATDEDRTSLSVYISQPLAQNAFGKAIQLQDNLIGIENQISRYQIVEAYEDYLAALTSVWYDWYSAYENLKVADAAIQSGQQLLNNILERKRQKIALPVDVNKMQLSLIAKKENRVILQNIYDNLSNLVYSAIRFRVLDQSGVRGYVPAAPREPVKMLEFKQEYDRFISSSRTSAVLNLLEQQSGLQLEQAADDLLPSTDLLLGYELDAQQWGSRNRDNSFFAGISVSWPLGRTVDRARYEIKRIQKQKTHLSNQSKIEELRTNLKNLHQQIQREQQLMEISQQKISLAEAILKDEKENYSFGKISLNDYITAVNNVDENRFSYTAHTVQLNKLLVEWMRLADRLVDRDDPDSL